LVWEHGNELFDQFLADLNSTVEHIRITYKVHYVSGEWLDVVVRKCLEYDGDKVPLRVRAHQKVLNRYLYIPRDSFHASSVYKGFIKGECVRYIITNSDEGSYHHVLKLFKARLLQRGYAEGEVLIVIASVKYADRSLYLQGRSSVTSVADQVVLVVPNGAQAPSLRLQQCMDVVYARLKDALSSSQAPVVA
jgi:hypothetical protein